MNKFITVITIIFCSPLVHATCLSSIPETTPTSRFTNNVDGSVTDTVTKLMWKKCSEGQVWASVTNTCTGATAFYTWREALQRAESVSAGVVGENLGYADWRVPNVKELTSILEYRCFMPSVNLKVFPPDDSYDGRGYTYWSSTIDSINSGSMYTVSFRASGTIPRPHNMSTPAPSLRLVRDSQ